MKSINLTINGEPRRISPLPGRTLLEVLREDLRLTGAKQSCEHMGQCGACTVIVNRKAVRSCLVKAESLEGAEVITIEGLGTPANPHLLQQAFVAAGAVQCGFCTPGMIMAAKGLLDQNPNPTPEQIKQALRHNLCRCTGYKKIIEAVSLAARLMSGETSPDELFPDPAAGVMGVSLPRPTGLERACGTARFTADIFMQGALELAVVRSPHKAALIKGINTEAAAAMPGVAGVITAKDIKGTNRLAYLVDDQPLLCEDRVTVLGDPVAAVAAETKEQALAAVAAVQVDYQPMAPVATLDEALAPGARQVHPGRENLCFTQPLVKGEAEAALAEAHTVVEESFATQQIHQAALEPEAALAYLSGDPEEPTLVVIGRGINIHHHVMVLQDALGHDDIIYQEAYSGGQFGMKLDITAEGLAAATALALKQPVRYVSTLSETMLMTTKRHPVRATLKLGADAQGNLTGLMVDFTLENGAYTSWGNVILLRCLQMLSGAYHIPHIKALGKLVYTNNAWGGAARGAGPPQMNFMLESAMDLLAAKLGLDPVELRRRNLLEPGQATAVGNIVSQWPIDGCLEQMAPLYEKALARAQSAGNGTVKRGVGLACGSFGIGKAGPGDKSMVAVELDEDGGVTVFGSVADPGEGNDAMLTQIASHLLGIPPSKVRLVTRDTSRTPDSSSASGSRVTYMSGGALEDAARQLQAAMDKSVATNRQGLVKAGLPYRYLGIKTQATTPLDPATCQGFAYENQVHGVQMAEIEVDTATGEVKVVKMTTAVDAGTVINPHNLTGQLEGGMDMGVGMALREQYRHGQTTDWRGIKFPTVADSFATEHILRQTPRDKGTLGAVGVSEFVLLPTVAAVLNALRQATGVSIQELPATPEKVLSTLKAQGSQG